MVWENEDIEDKNMEQLRNQFGLENLMDAKVLTDANDIAALATDLGEGQFRLVYESGNLRLYTMYNGTIYYLQFTAV